MAATSVLLPHDAGASQNSTVTIGGSDFTQIAAIQTSRIKANAVGSTAAGLVVANECCFMKNFFNDTQIPSDATITGIEVVATTSSGVAASHFSSGGASSGEFKFTWFFYNGSAFSSALAHVGDVSGIFGVTSTDSGASLTFNTASRRYLNNTAGDDVLFGGTSNLSGLSWDPANQAEFGLAVTITDTTGTVVGIWVRGIGLRCTYTVAGFGKVACGVSTASTISGIDVPTSVINITSS